jgi:hypothetical protein
VSVRIGNSWYAFCSSSHLCFRSWKYITVITGHIYCWGWGWVELNSASSVCLHGMDKNNFTVYLFTITNGISNYTFDFFFSYVHTLLILIIHLQLLFACLKVCRNDFKIIPGMKYKFIYCITQTKVTEALMWSGSIIVNIVTRFWVGWSVPEIWAGARDFSLLQNIQTGSGAHPASYSMGMGGYFLRSEAGGTWGWPLTFVYFQG